MEKEHHIFGFIGLTTSGKTSLSKHLTKTFGLIHTPSITTRPIRKGAPDEYKHVSVEMFQNHIKNNDLLEYTDLPGHFYGKLKKDIKNSTDKFHMVYNLTPDKVKDLKKFHKNTKIILIEPEGPLFKTIEKRLRKRGHNNKEVIRRLEMAKKELKFIKEIKKAKLVDHIIHTLNNDYNHALREVEKVVKKHL